MSNIVLTVVSLPDGKELAQAVCRDSKVTAIKLLRAQEQLQIFQKQFKDRVGKVVVVWEMPNSTKHLFWLSDNGVWLTDEDKAFDECEAYRSLVLATRELKAIFMRNL